jgi:integrase
MARGKLSALKLKGLTSPGRYGDGDGLWLQVRDASHRSWLLRYSFGGRPRQMGLGPFPDVSLADAREAAREARAVVRKGLDPIEERQKAKGEQRRAMRGMTFRQAADRYVVAHEASWRNEKHRWQWGQTLNVACEAIGKTPVTVIATADVMRALLPIWRTKTETAARLRGRIESVLDFATAHGWRTGENPARWRGHLANLLPPPGKLAKVKHHAALPWQQIGHFLAELRDHDGVAARALEFTILTAARTGETIGSTKLEIDLKNGVWTVPESRMKAGLEHRVPLSGAALAVLDAVAPLWDVSTYGWLFPGASPGKPLSNMAMIMLLRRMGHNDLTVHGFRSTLRDWAAEATNHPREIAEKALAHVVGDETERSYQRGDLLEKRRRLMEDWAKFCARPVTPPEVIPIRA